MQHCRYSFFLFAFTISGESASETHRDTQTQADTGGMLAQRDTDRGGRVLQKKKALELEESSVPGEEQDGMQPAAFPFLSRHTTKYASIGSAQ